jgi:hypothetical protein
MKPHWRNLVFRVQRNDTEHFNSLNLEYYLHSIAVPSRT